MGERGKWVLFFLGIGLFGHAAAYGDRALVRLSLAESLSVLYFAGLIFMLGWWWSENRFRHIIDAHNRRQEQQFERFQRQEDAQWRHIRLYARKNWIDISNTFGKDVDRNMTSMFFYHVCIVINFVYRNNPTFLFEDPVARTVIDVATEEAIGAGLQEPDVIFKRAEITRERLAQFSDVNDLVNHSWIQNPMVNIRQINVPQ